MHLVLEIALGIVLAFVIITHCEEILSLGILLAIFGVILAVVGFGVWIVADSLMTNKENIDEWVITMTFLIVVSGGSYWLWGLRAKRKGKSLKSRREDLGYGEDGHEHTE